MKIEKEGLFRHIRAISLPSLSSVLVELLEYTLDEEYDIEEIVNIISKDPALCSRILKVANSPFCGKGTISTIRHALVYLGSKNIKYIAISSAIAGMFSRLERLQKIGFDLGRFWSHSIRIAIICRSLACKMHYELPDEVFVAGLLHDIGQLILAQSFPEEYKKVIEKIKAGQVIINAEQEVFGVDSARVGAWVMQQWRFPSPLPEVAEEQRQPLYEMQNLGSKIVYIAHLLATSHTLSVENKEFYLKSIVKEIEPVVFLSLEDIEHILTTSVAEEVIVANTLGIHIKDSEDWKIAPIFQNQLNILEKLFTFLNIWSDSKEYSLLTDVLKHIWQTLNLTFGTEKIILWLFDKKERSIVSKMGFDGISIPVDKKEDMIAEAFCQKRILHSKELKNRGLKLDSKLEAFFEDKGFFILPLYRKDDIGLILLEDTFPSEQKGWKRLLLWIAEAVGVRLKAAMLSSENKELSREKEKIEGELREVLERLIELERRTAAIETTRTIAHTLNQSIMVIQGRAELSMRKLNKETKEYKDLEKIIGECIKMQNVIQKLSTITKYERKSYDKERYILDIENLL